MSEFGATVGRPCIGPTTAPAAGPTAPGGAVCTGRLAMGTCCPPAAGVGGFVGTDGPC